MLGFIKRDTSYIDGLEKEVEHHYEEILGKNVHYITFGNGPLIVLIHGWNNDWSGFIPFIKHLDGFEVLAIDLPGYGESESLSSAYSVSKLAEVVGLLLNKINRRADIVVCLSMGTVIGVELANKHQKVLKKLVLIGPPIMKYDWVWSKIFRWYVKFLNSNFVFRFLGKHFMGSYWYGHFTAKYMNMYRYKKELINKFGLRGRKRIKPKALFQMGNAIYHYKMADEMRNLSLPTLVILGRFDKLINLSEAARIHHEKENIRLFWVEDAGHVVSLEKPKTTAKAVKEFI